MGDCLVAVGPASRIRGVRPPEESETSDWREKPGSPLNTRKVRAHFEVLSLRTALARCWSSDAHLVTYLLYRDGAPLDRQPRITKASLPWIREQGYTVLHHAFFADLDNPGHVPWTLAMMTEFEHQWLTIPALQTAGVYVSRRGWRAFQLLDTPLTPEEYEPRHQQWMATLIEQGLRPDLICRDWTRFFRLPHVQRDGTAFRAPIVRTERMVAIPPPEPCPEVERELRKEKRIAAAKPDLTWCESVPPPWRFHLVALGRAVAQYSSGRHPLFFAFTGALLERGAPPEQVPSICRAVAGAAGIPDPEKRESSSRDAVQRKLAGGRLPGCLVLAARWPEVAKVMDAIHPVRHRLRHADPERAPTSRTLAVQTLSQAMKAVTDRLKIFINECGLGKSHQLRDFAVARARTPYRSAKAAGQRAAVQSKTSISVPTHTLAREYVAKIREIAPEIPVKRIFNPLTLLDEHGKPVCKLYDVAKPLQDGGISMQWNLCQGRRKRPCEHAQTCEARKGFEGDENALITIGAHPQLPTLVSEAGKTGVLATDEPPDLLETRSWIQSQIAMARAALMEFEADFATVMQMPLAALEWWCTQPRVATELSEIVKMWRETFPEDEATEALQTIGNDSMEQWLKKACIHGIPVKLRAILKAKRDRKFAYVFGPSCQVISFVAQAIHQGMRAVARVDLQQEFYTLSLTCPRGYLVQALNAEIPVMVLDANAENNVGIYEKIVGYIPDVVRISVGDGSPIERTILKTSRAARSHLFDEKRRPQWDAILPMVQAAMTWVQEQPSAQSIALITYKRLAALCLAACGQESPEAAEELSSDRPTRADLAGARERLGPVLSGYTGLWMFGWYHALRGLDRFKDVDALITLGDPIEHIPTLRHDAAYLSLDPQEDPEEAWQKRLVDRASAELEQAQGRIRPVWREKPGRALHIGRIVPGGTGWQEHFERSMPSGPPVQTQVLMTPEAFRAARQARGLSHAELAVALGVDRSSVMRYESGARSIPAHIASKLAK